MLQETSYLLIGRQLDHGGVLVALLVDEDVAVEALGEEEDVLTVRKVHVSPDGVKTRKINWFLNRHNS